jgi:hypothetical protein
MQKETYIWGAGHYGVLTALDLENKDIKIKGFIDKDAMQIKTRLGLPVFEPSEVISANGQKFKIVIAVQNEEAVEEITENLQSLGLEEDEDFKMSSLLSEKEQTAKIFDEYYIPKYGRTDISKAETSKKIIYMADGRCNTRGLADRLRGMVSLYKIAKELNVDYKINMTSPVDLSNYLVPNKYNWLINSDEIIYDVKKAVILTFWTGAIAEWDMLKTIRYSLKKLDQVHITTNVGFDVEYGKLFDELFRPSDELKSRIEYHLSKIGGEFISASFRFLQLLGDFSEPASSVYPILPEKEQIALRERCVEHLIEIYKENNYKKIFVASDSITFLNKVKDMDFVYVVPGEVAHINKKGLEKDMYMKIFVDYFLLTHSKMRYLVIDGQMYKSGFPQTAALHDFPLKIKRY